MTSLAELAQTESNCSRTEATKARILAVDDTPDILMLLKLLLGLDYDLTTATSGAEAISAVKANTFDLIILDVMMPGLSGFETLQRIQLLPNFGTTPVIFLTAADDAANELHGLGLGAHDYIAKPFKPSLLLLRVNNIVQRIKMQRELATALNSRAKSEERLRFVMEATGEGIWDWLVPSDSLINNASWCRIVGLDEHELEHTMAFVKALIHPEDLESVSRVLDACLDHDEPLSIEHRVRHANGHYVWVEKKGRVVERDEDGTAVRMVCSVRDISERKKMEAEYRRLALFDTLTGLPNRRLLVDRLQQAISQYRRDGESGAIMFIDMDRFKEVNDTFGHDAGDQLLIEVGRRLSACIRTSDTVARLGGDEFVVMLTQLHEDREANKGYAAKVAQKILEALGKPYHLGPVVCSSSPSIGLVMFSGAEGETVDALIRNADSAMYEAKQSGRNRLRIAD